MTTKNDIVSGIEAQLDMAAQVRAGLAADPKGQAGREALRVWQADRLARTHTDLLENPRFASTAYEAFLHELYGDDAARGRRRAAHPPLWRMRHLAPVSQWWPTL